MYILLLLIIYMELSLVFQAIRNVNFKKNLLTSHKKEKRHEYIFSRRFSKKNPNEVVEQLSNELEGLRTEVDALSWLNDRLLAAKKSDDNLIRDFGTRLKENKRAQRETVKQLAAVRGAFLRSLNMHIFALFPLIQLFRKYFYAGPTWARLKVTFRRL